MKKYLVQDNRTGGYWNGGDFVGYSHNAERLFYDEAQRIALKNPDRYIIVPL
jgi:hypothetical protein